MYVSSCAVRGMVVLVVVEVDVVGVVVVEVDVVGVSVVGVVVWGSTITVAVAVAKRVASLMSLIL